MCQQSLFILPDICQCAKTQYFCASKYDTCYSAVDRDMGCFHSVIYSNQATVIVGYKYSNQAPTLFCYFQAKISGYSVCSLKRCVLTPCNPYRPGIFCLMTYAGLIHRRDWKRPRHNQGDKRFPWTQVFWVLNQSQATWASWSPQTQPQPMHCKHRSLVPHMHNQLKVRGLGSNPGSTTYWAYHFGKTFKFLHFHLLHCKVGLITEPTSMVVRIK